MQNNKLILGLLIGIMILSFVSLFSKNGSQVFGSPERTFFSSNGTFASSTASTTVQQYVNANTGRSFLRVCNDGGNAVYLFENSTSTGMTAQTGIRLSTQNNGESCYVIGGTNGYVYTGKIFGATLSGTSTVAIFER